MKNLFKFPVHLAATTNSKPMIITIFHPNGSYELEGSDMMLLKALADVLNFKIDVTLFDYEGTIYDNGTSTGTFKALHKGKADLKLSSWWIKFNGLVFFESTNAYTFDKFVMIVPPGSKLTSFEKLIFPFTASVWVSVFSVFLVGFSVIKIVNMRSDLIKSFIFGARVQHPSFNMLIGFIGGMQKILPRRNFARFLLMSFLMYSLVIRTLYQASYYQFLQSNKMHKPFQSADEIFATDLTIYAPVGIADLWDGVETMKERFRTLFDDAE